MTFNIQHCLNYLGRDIDFPLFSDAIAKSGADIVGLNEVRGKGETAAYEEQTDILADGAGYKYRFFAPAIRFRGTEPYGNAILSKYPIISAQVVMIPDPAVKRYPGYYETRCVCKTVIDAGATLTVLSVHFGLNPDEHRNARDTVLKEIEDTRCVLMGDFNVKPSSRILSPIRKAMNDAADAFDGVKYSFPSDRPDRKIDYIFTSRDIKILSADIPPLVVSDHRPHTADIEIK